MKDTSAKATSTALSGLQHLDKPATNSTPAIPNHKQKLQTLMVSSN